MKNSKLKAKEALTQTKRLLSYKFLILILLFPALFCLASCESTQAEKTQTKGSFTKKYFDHLREAVKKDPENPAVHFELGNAYFRIKEYGRASDAYEEVLGLEKAVWQDKAVACVYIAKVEEIDKDYSAAMRWYDKGLGYEGDKGTYVAGNKGLLLEKQKKFKEAVELYYTILSRKNLSTAEKEEFKKRIYAIRFVYEMKKGNLIP